MIEGLKDSDDGEELSSLDLTATAPEAAARDSSTTTYHGPVEIISSLRSISPDFPKMIHAVSHTTVKSDAAKKKPSPNRTVEGKGVNVK